MSEAEVMLIEDLDRATDALRDVPETEDPKCTVHHNPIREALIVLLRIERHRMTEGVKAEGASKTAVGVITSVVSTVVAVLAQIVSNHMHQGKP